MHFACARWGGATAHREAHYGAIGRGRIRLECVRMAMTMLLEMVDER